jgi:peroxiredoxin
MTSKFRAGVLLLTALAAAPIISAATPPATGDKAPEFTLSDMKGEKVGLSGLVAKSPVVLVVLRGFPGYQCPYCTRQVNEFVARAADFSKSGVSVVFIYPGPPDDLNAHAAGSAAGKPLPSNFLMLLDPGYEFTNLYGLRWNADRETAYPSTFLIDRQGKIFFARISNTHGGRTSAQEVLDALAASAAR